MNPLNESLALRGLTRRHFFSRCGLGLGSIALASLLNERLFAAAESGAKPHGALGGLHFAAKAKRVIYLHMAGGPSHIDLLDYKPQLANHHGQELPATVRMGQRITGMTSIQKSFPCVAPMFKFATPLAGMPLNTPSIAAAHR